MKTYGEDTITSKMPPWGIPQLWTRARKWIVEQMVSSFGEAEPRGSLLSVKGLQKIAHAPDNDDERKDHAQ
jgi:hypothetical protein